MLIFLVLLDVPSNIHSSCSLSPLYIAAYTVLYCTYRKSSGIDVSVTSIMEEKWWKDFEE